MLEWKRLYYKEVATLLKLKSWRTINRHLNKGVLIKELNELGYDVRICCDDTVENFRRQIWVKKK